MRFVQSSSGNAPSLATRHDVCSESCAAWPKDELLRDAHFCTLDNFRKTRG
jgi:hypothetical protein